MASAQRHQIGSSARSGPSPRPVGRGAWREVVEGDTAPPVRCATSPLQADVRLQRAGSGPARVWRPEDGRSRGRRCEGERDDVRAAVEASAAS